MSREGLIFFGILFTPIILALLLNFLILRSQKGSKKVEHFLLSIPVLNKNTKYRAAVRSNREPISSEIRDYRESQHPLPSIPHPKGSVVSSERRALLSEKVAVIRERHERKQRYWAMFFLLFIIVGAGLGLYLITSSALVCSKRTDICEVQEQHLWERNFKTKSTIRLSTVSRAYVNSEHDDEEGWVYFLVFQTNRGIIRVFDWVSPHEDMLQDLANRFNAFLSNNQEVLELSQDTNHLRSEVADQLYYVLLIIPALCGLAFKKRRKAKEP